MVTHTTNKPVFISFASHKGGVAKTTSTINVSAALAQLGHRVLVIDLDPQAALTATIALPEDQNSAKAYALMKLNGSTEGYTSQSTIKDVDIVPANGDMSLLEHDIIQKRTTVFDAINNIRKLRTSGYDYILIDTTNYLGNIMVIGITSADMVIVPAYDYYGVKSIEEILRIIRTVSSRTEHTIHGPFPVLVKYDRRTSLAKATWKILENNYRNSRFNTIVPQNIRIVEASIYNTSIFKHAPESSGAEAYMALTKEIITTAEGIFNEDR